MYMNINDEISISNPNFENNFGNTRILILKSKTQQLWQDICYKLSVQ